MPQPTGSTRTRITNLSSATTSQVLLPTGQRFGVSIYNDSTATLYLKLGNNACSTSSYTVQLYPSGYYETPFNYSGELNGVWSSVNGNALITEYL